MNSIENKTYIAATQFNYFWNIEILNKELSGLPIDILCITAKETNNKLRIFIPNKYKNPSYYYAILIDKDSPKFLYNNIIGKIHIKSNDINKIFIFIKKKWRFFIKLANSNITIMDLYIQSKYNKFPLKESICYSFKNNVLNEMTNVSSEIVNLPTELWIDTAGIWLNTGHGYRFKFKDNITKKYISILLPDLTVDKKAKTQIKNKNLKKLIKWAEWNMDLFDEIKYGISDNIDHKEFLFNNLTILKNGYPCHACSYDEIIEVTYETITYQIIKKITSGKFNILWRNDLISKYWCDSIKKHRYSDIHQCNVFDVVYKGIEHIITEFGELI